MISIKRLNSASIDGAASLLYEANTYHQEGSFLDDHRPRLCIKPANQESQAADFLNHRAIWFGVFDKEKLVGCARLLNISENPQSPIHNELLCSAVSADEYGRCYEIHDIAIKENYAKLGIIKGLLLACFQFAQENQYPLAALTHKKGEHLC